MPVQCLNYAQKKLIKRLTINETLNQTELSNRLNVSRRTIQRVLIEAGLLVYNTKATPVKPTTRVLDDVEMLTLLRRYYMTPVTLKEALHRAHHV